MNRTISYMKGEANNRKKGAPFYQVTLKEVLDHCKNNLPRNGQKHAHGAVFPYVSECLGIQADSLSGGYIFIDIDNISKQTAEQIYNHFDELRMHLPFIQAIQFSSSYYIDPVKAGLHFYVCSEVNGKDDHFFLGKFMLYGIAVILEHALNISLTSITGGVVLDDHNCKLSHRFALFYSDYKYIEDVPTFTEDYIKESDLEKLNKIYPEAKIEKPKATKDVNFGTSSRHYAVGTKTIDGKICIDRNITIGKWSGHDLRGRISREARAVFGSELAKQRCDEFFYYENGKSIYSEWKGDGYSPAICEWLEEIGFFQKKVNDHITWMSERKDEIKELILKNKKTCITAPTGSGKTTLINGTEDVTGLAHDLNAVVIVPFNMTRNLYSNMVMVRDLDRETPNGPCVMVIDQAVRRWKEICHRTLLVDESHVLFMDTDYRDKCIDLYNHIKNEDVRVCFISATPTGEKNLADVCKEYYTHRDDIRLTIQHTINPEYDMMNLVTVAVTRGWYDRVVVFSNLYIRKIHDNLVKAGWAEDICYVRKETENSDLVVELKQNELLTKKITLSTCVGYNGLNFKNENEKILVVGSINEGEDIVHSIVQQLGRVRKSKVVGKYFYVEKKNTRTIDEKVQITKEHRMLESMGCCAVTTNEKWEDTSYIESQKEREVFIEKYSNIEGVIEYLNGTGYIIGKYIAELTTDKHYRMDNKLKRGESNDIREDIKSGKYEEMSVNGGYDGAYNKEWEHTINRWLNDERYEGLTLDFFSRVIGKDSANKLMDTILDEIYDAIRVCAYDDSEWQWQLDNKQRWVDMLSDRNDKLYLIRKMNRLERIRNEYKEDIRVRKIVYGVTVGDPFYDAVAAAMNAVDGEELQAQIEGNIKGGKKGSPKKAVTVTDAFKRQEKYGLSVGQSFESCEELASYAKVHNSRVTDWVKKGWLSK